MTSVRQNLIANLVGKGWTALMALAFVPLYVKFLGIEAYGLVGFFTALQALLGVLDLGLSPTLNREMARYSANSEEAGSAADLLHTLQLVSWAVAILIGLAVWASSGWIATQWVRAETMTPDQVQQAVVLMGIVMALQWPMSLYTGGLMGLQRQVLWNSTSAAVATLRSIGCVVILSQLSSTIAAFFSWQAIIAGVQTLLVGVLLWRSVPQSFGRPRFRRESLASVWRFATGMTAISILALVLMQADKVILSKMLTLDIFGYYVLAAMVASALPMISNSVFQAVYPAFSRLVASGDENDMGGLYHRTCQLTSVLIIPAGAAIVAFAPEIMLLWTRDEVIAENTQLLVRVLAVGMVLNGLMNPPYALQLAHGWTRLTILSNTVAIIVLVPLMVAMAMTYGAVGAAAVWPVLNAGYVLIALRLMHRRLLPGELWTWYARDVGLPLTAAITVIGLGRWLLAGPIAPPVLLLYVVAFTCAAMAASALAAPSTRGWAGFVYRRLGFA